jgi:hypothetical protein
MDNTEMFGIATAHISPEATYPEPPDHGVHAATYLSLLWNPGVSAVSHDVYLAESFDDVRDGTGDSFRGNHTGAFFLLGFGVTPNDPAPGGLVSGTTYYWRIDEVNDANPDSPWRGDVWSFSIAPETAYNPYPADKGAFTHPNVTLSWMAGLGAKWHTVYFGDNFDDVNNAADGLPQMDTTYTLGTLEWGKQYYWRVDEWDVLTTHKGEVWSFTTLPAPDADDPNIVGRQMFDEGH